MSQVFKFSVVNRASYNLKSAQFAFSSAPCFAFTILNFCGMAARIADNINPQRFSKQSKREITKEEEDESIEDPIDEREIFGK